MPRPVRVGPHHANRAELWLPAQHQTPVPTVVVIHGGYWRAMYTKRLMRPMADAITELGWAAWNIEYRRTGPLGGGGGWPGTFDDVARAIDHLAEVAEVDTSRVVTCGHSAGGHLALWAASRPGLPAGTPGADPRVRVRGAVSLAGVVDLERAAALSLGNGAVETLLDGPPERRAERYALASPAARLPLGVPQVLLHGLADDTVPPELSASYQRRAAALGDDVGYVPLEGVDHMAIIDPAAASWPATVDALRALLG
ncbi:S9 family peptidase [Acidiferrimicrobium sp. IK]|uniref:alpha/beta hydrolase family protein n=1 Tax=Acidiferrimicrobium sp. IK TaxID=2871700 RepID=UPI0021CB4D55|nr:S9 family peptidase [Acidiferrimicrobium sp. IK]MCU4185527.1 S9 family peptidase [Acidiferrimicrobium sp. IK]